MQPEFVPHDDRHVPPEGALEALRRFHGVLKNRRSVRAFSDRPVPREVIEELVRCAASAPSGANKQPWRFVAVGDVRLKRAIREAAEAEERSFYAERASRRWLDDLEPLGTDADKGFLEVAPWLVAIFRLSRADDGGQVYYGEESVGIAVGMFLAAAQVAGLATLTHTPSPMRFLGELLGRPAHERPYLLVPVGYPADNCLVPRLARERRPLEETLVVHPPGDR